MPNEYSIEFKNSKYKRVVIINDETYQKFIKENGKLKTIRAFIIENRKKNSLNKTMIIRKTQPEKILSGTIEKKEKLLKPISNKKKFAKTVRTVVITKSIILRRKKALIISKLVKLAPPRIPTTPIYYLCTM